MAVYTIKTLAAATGFRYSSLQRKIKELESKKKFKRKNPGKLLVDEDVKKICLLLGVDLQVKK